MTAGTAPSPRRWLRPIFRWAMLAAAMALAWPVATWAPVILPALSPFVAISALPATRALGAIGLLALPALLLALAYPRWFCRYACPTGLLQETVERFRPGGRPGWKRVPRVGNWLVAMTVAGAIVGYPLFLWLDPLAIFQGFANAWRWPLNGARLVAGLGLPAILLLDVIAPRLWCRRLCPLGATQDLLAWPRRLRRRRGAAAEPPIPARRLLIAGCAGAAGALALRRLRGKAEPPLRPPGSIAEGSFAAVCTRCGNCIRACPTRIIAPDASGVLSLLTPRLSFADGYCREDCCLCGQVCPSGAIARLDLAGKRCRVIGPVRIDLDLCLLAAGRECTTCITQCPYEAIAIHAADDGFSTEPRVDLTKCTGCGACEAACPVRPARAICVIPRPGMLKA